MEGCSMRCKQQLSNIRSSRQIPLLRHHVCSSPHQQRSQHPKRSAGKAAPVLFQPTTSSEPVGAISETEKPVKGDRRATLSWAGAGIFFFWQLGAMKFLSERFDLTQVPMAGASGGALVSVLAACGVPADKVLQRAYDLSMKYKIWERPMGLMGVWGSLIEEWLDSLLPEDAADRCRNRVNIVVTQLPSLAQVGITDFKSKADLINVAMASSHIPIFLDMRVARLCRGSYCVDGSFPDFFYNENSDLLQLGGDAVVFDYFFDVNIPRKGRMDMLEVKTFEEVQHIMQLGYEYAARLSGDGQFDHFETGQFSLNPLDRESPLHPTSFSTATGTDSSTTGSSSSRPAPPTASTFPLLSTAAALTGTPSPSDIQVALAAIEESKQSPTPHSTQQLLAEPAGVVTSLRKFLDPIKAVLRLSKKDESAAQ